MLLVTGGAGFIGSNVVASLNEAGRTDVVVNDSLGNDGKWRNLGSRQLADFVPPADLMRWLDGRKLDAVMHLGAISSTTATDGDVLIESNFRLSLRLLDWCTATRTPFIYASSAATYGDGARASPTTVRSPRSKRLKPMNLYGWSKHLFDLAVVERAAPQARTAAAMGRAQVLQRVRSQRIPQGRDDESRRQALRRRQGRQSRSGCSSRTVRASPTASKSATSSTSTMRWRSCAGCSTRRRYPAFSMSAPATARSFRDLITAMFAALGREPAIEYIEMPVSIRDSYQYFTQAETANLRRAGYNAALHAARR